MDPFTASAIGSGALSAIGSIGGSLISSGMSRDMSRDQMNFQREMSNTAHQREVEDLRKAGLNPILSALGQGASTPQGAQGSVNDLGAGISKGMDTAIAIKQQAHQLKNLDADTGNKEMTKDLIGHQVASTAEQVKATRLQNKLIQATMPSAIKKIKAEGDFSEANQVMGLIRQGTESLGNMYPRLNIKNAPSPGGVGPKINPPR